MLKIVKQKMVVGLFLVSIFGPYIAKAVNLSPLMEAILNTEFKKEEEPKALKLIEKSTPDEINWRNDIEFTAMDYALMGGNYKIVEALVEKGAKINELDNSGFTPLRMAILFTPEKNRKEIVELLLANGADPNVKDFKNITPFFSAVRRGYVPVLEALFAGKIKPDLGVKAKWFCIERSCLAEAIHNEKLPVVKLLVEQGANVAEYFEEGGKLYNLAEWAKYFQKAPEIADYLKPFCPKKPVEEEGKQFDGAKMQCEKFKSGPRWKYSRIDWKDSYSRRQDMSGWGVAEPKLFCPGTFNAVVGLNSSDEQKTLKK